PDPLRAARVRTIRIMSCAPAFSAVARAAQSLALLSAVVPFCGPAVAAIPGGSGAVLRRRHRVAVSQKGCRPGGLRLKDFMPAWRRLAAAARAT
ncbi:TPA: hypothetical protein P4F72_004838, partial [Escherichia coli]|nr:hypothetical protein [Escherichia coli]